MKILMICPTFGGLQTYINSLVKEIRSLGQEVDHIGSRQQHFPFDQETKEWQSTEWTIEQAKDIIKDVDFPQYDVICFHYGKNDVEQYIPVLLKDNADVKAKSIYFVHFLSRGLFSRYLKDEETQKDVNEQVYDFFKSYIYFGTYSKKYMETESGKSLHGIVSFYPEAHSESVFPDKEAKIFHDSLTFPENHLPGVYIVGYGANYKDHTAIIKSLEFVKTPFKLVFAGPGWKKRLGFEYSKIGNVDVYVIDRELNEKEFLYLNNLSLFGLFPYRQPEDNSEAFQGSGVLPNYIFQGKACVVFNDGCLPEYIGEGGIVVNNYKDGIELAAAIDSMLDESKRQAFEKIARERSVLFSVGHHAKECLTYFKTKL